MLGLVYPGREDSVDLKEFKLEAKELALGGGLQYQTVPEGHIYLTSQNMKMWIAYVYNGEVEKIIDPEKDQEWVPELWLEIYRRKLRKEEART